MGLRGGAAHTPKDDTKAPTMRRRFREGSNGAYTQEEILGGRTISVARGVIVSMTPEIAHVFMPHSYLEVGITMPT